MTNDTTTTAPSAARHSATPTVTPKVQFPTLRTIELRTSDIEMRKIVNEETKKVSYTATVEGKTYNAGQRFKSSIMGILGMGISVLDYWDFDEAVSRFHERKPKKAKTIKLTIDETNRTALAAISPGRFLPDMESTLQLIKDLDGRVTYENGELLALCKPAMETNFKIMQDAFQIRNSFRIPLDGYGAPLHYVGMLREVCSNGMVAWGKIWSTICTFGKKTDPAWAMERFLKSISNVEAETRLRERLEVATDTLASLEDISKLMKRLDKSSAFDGGKFLDMVLDADLSVTQADMNQFTPRDRGRIASQVTVYDLINMATEAFTHHGVAPAAGFLGSIMTGTFDLEGVADDTAVKRITAAKDRNPAFWLNDCLAPTGRAMGVIPDLSEIAMRTFTRLNRGTAGIVSASQLDAIDAERTDADDIEDEFADFNGGEVSVLSVEPASASAAPAVPELAN